MAFSQEYRSRIAAHWARVRAWNRLNFDHQLSLLDYSESFSSEDSQVEDSQAQDSQAEDSQAGDLPPPYDIAIKQFAKTKSAQTV
jgi:hypothetical protein